MDEPAQSRRLSIESMDVAPGWQAYCAWSGGRGGYIVLVELMSTGAFVMARLDLGKGIFIDPLPFKPTQSAVDALAQAIAKEVTG